jgi:hypothetical protein
MMRFKHQSFGYKVTKKVKWTLVQALRPCTGRTGHRGSRGIALLYRHWGSVQAVRPLGGVEGELYSFMTNGIRRGWGDSITPRPLFTPRKDPVPNKEAILFLFNFWCFGMQMVKIRILISNISSDIRTLCHPACSDLRQNTDTQISVDLHAISITFHCLKGARAGAVGWGTAIHVGRSRVRFPMVSLEFFIDIILPAALWPRGTLSLQQKWVPGIFPGGKGGRCVGLTTLPPSWAECLEIWELQPPVTLSACPGL